MLYGLYETKGRCKRMSVKTAFTRELKEGKKAVISSNTSEQQVRCTILPHSDK